MPKVIHFEIPAIDAQRALSFYASAFGWMTNELGEGAGYWVCRCGPDAEAGIDGAIMDRRAEGQPVVTTIRVDSVDEACASITEAGGTIVVPKFEVPGLGYKAFFKDSEGNIMGIAQPLLEDLTI
jgi:uncharacterized protein